MNKLERRLRAIGRMMSDAQVARFWKVPEEMTQTPCDFFGYDAKGRAILIEAKSVDRPRLPVGCSPGLLTHQWNELCDAHRAGALALVVWLRIEHVMVMMVDPAFVGKSIPWCKERAWPFADLWLALDACIHLPATPKA